MIDLNLVRGDMTGYLRHRQPDESVDLIVTSPPYNVGVDYGDGVDDGKPFNEYADFVDKAMCQMARILKTGGRACIEVGGSGRNFPLSWVWQNAAFKYGLGLFGEIAIQHRKTSQCAWGSWLRADAVNTIPNFHMLHVFYKVNDRKISGGHTRVHKAEWMEWTRGYWHIDWSTGNHGHPAAFPMELPIRCLKLFGHAGDVVLDPFAGCGTTGRACISLGDVSFIGIEIVQKFFDEMKRTLEFENAQMRLFDDRYASWVEERVVKSGPSFVGGRQLSFFEDTGI